MPSDLSATFIQAFSKIGLVPDTGGTFFLSRIVGHKKALALMMLGDKLTALEAKEICIVEDVFPDEQFFVSVNKIAEKLAKMPTKSLALTKKLLLASINNDLNAQLDLELEFQVIAANSYDYNEGVSAFLEKRKPEFIGR